MNDIKILRKKISGIDEEILKLLVERISFAKEVGEAKNSLKLPVLDKDREAQILANVSEGAKNLGLDPEDVRAVFREIVAMSRRIQGEETQVTYLGPQGAFAEEAARCFFSLAKNHLTPSLNTPEVFRGVESSEFMYGVVPIENSSEGSVPVTLDLLMESDLKIYGEIELKVMQNLVVKPGSDLKNIKIILSHPQGLLQCRSYLARNFPAAELRETSSTSKAVELLSEMPHAAAIASETAAQRYNMVIAAKGIQDNPRNFTRFLVLSKKDHVKTGKDKTSIIYSVEHIPGALCKTLEVFAANKVNIMKIESRPTKQRVWEYVFFLDFEGHREDPICLTLLNELKKVTNFMKVLGSYPIWIQ